GSPLAIRAFSAAFIWLLIPTILWPRTPVAQACGWLIIVDGSALILLAVARTWSIVPRNPLRWLRDAGGWTRFTIWLFWGPPSTDDTKGKTVWWLVTAGAATLIGSIVYRLLR
ncbi:MAG: hypothetical protein ACRD1T_12790, partial [Acidimicrobiia bacterium]